MLRPHSCEPDQHFHVAAENAHERTRWGALKADCNMCNESSAAWCGDGANLERQRGTGAKPNWESLKLISLQLVK